MKFNWQAVVENSKKSSGFDNGNIISVYGGQMEISRRVEGVENMIIRLIAHPDDEFPIIDSYQHGIKSNGKFKWHFCYKSVDKNCPICNQSSKSYTENKNDTTWRILKATNYKKVRVLVVQSERKDILGKSFILSLDAFRDAGLIEKIYNAPPTNAIAGPFDLKEGRNFNLSVQIKSMNNGGTGKIADFSLSKWENVSPINVDGVALSEDEINKIFESAHSLASIKQKESEKIPNVEEYIREFVEETGIYIDLDTDKVENIPKPSALSQQINESKEDLMKPSENAFKVNISSEPAKETKIETTENVNTMPFDEDDDDDFSFTKNLKKKHS